MGRKLHQLRILRSAVVILVTAVPTGGVLRAVLDSLEKEVQAFDSISASRAASNRSAGLVANRTANRTAPIVSRPATGVRSRRDVFNGTAALAGDSTAVVDTNGSAARPSSGLLAELGSVRTSSEATFAAGINKSSSLDPRAEEYFGSNSTCTRIDEYERVLGCNLGCLCSPGGPRNVVWSCYPHSLRLRGGRIVRQDALVQVAALYVTAEYVDVGVCGISPFLLVLLCALIVCCCFCGFLTLLMHVRRRDLANEETLIRQRAQAG